MRRPRTRCISASGSVTRSRPSNRISPATIRAGAGGRRSSDRLVTVFPLPDSPTIPSISPAATWKSTPSTARTTPSRTGKCTFNPRTDSKESAADTGIERIGQPVGQQVEPQNRNENRPSRRQRCPRRHLQRLVIEEQRLPPGNRLRIAKSQETDHRLRQDGP